MKCIRISSVVAIAICTSFGYAQTPFLKAAALFSGERKDDVFASMSQAQTQKIFSPLVKQSQDSAGFVIGAFALAMKGLDIDANLARLVAPIKDAHDEKIDELTASNGLAENQVLLEDIPNAIYLIYKTRHYSPALKTLLTMPVDWPAAEYRDDCIMKQLRTDPNPVMALAGQDSNIYQTLADIVDWNVGTMKDRNAFVHGLRTAHWPTSALKKTATRLAHDVAVPKNRPRK